MSGGTFDYCQYSIQRIIDAIEHEIETNGKEIQPNDRDHCDDRTHYYEYPPEVIAEFKNGVYALKKALIYANRVDYLIACDDGEQSFLSRLKEELEQLKQDICKP